MISLSGLPGQTNIVDLGRHAPRPKWPAITFSNRPETLRILIIQTGLDKSDARLAVYTVVTSEVLDHTSVRGKMYPLGFGRHGGVTLVKGVPR
jgi:hypothetical protein